ncbi:2-nitropropane dioxygenase [Fimicolochytrium jonesii]|uniref:2-nitropropane dioxygenase n=1 Tax=Fimicolochytrium jonesii TaxID=1396493 RepID=UPI0022FEB4FC|nr:2-nitropropane dioxygenase [Fimicolochytrium jonesii]KAI8825661.1 2-nitropropane dioxygenase [Fimicolochytrium jonesii]
MLRAKEFCERFGLKRPILLAPMAGACPASLSIAVANDGGMGAAGVLMMTSSQIDAWVKEFRQSSDGKFQLNNWIPAAPVKRNPEEEAKVRTFLESWGPPVPAEAGNTTLPNFKEQCEAMLRAKPAAISSIMGLYSADFVQLMKKEGISWFATVTTVEEAKLAEAAGADVILAQGFEAGGHRGSFHPGDAESRAVGLISLVPSIVDAVRIPVVAAGGIADPRQIAAALLLGASAVQIGTGFLRTPEAKTPQVYTDAIGKTAPENTRVTRAFSGRAGRSIATDFVRAASAPDAPSPAPYPVQRGLTAPMKALGQKIGDIHRMQAWAGQSAALAEAAPAGEVLTRLWDATRKILQDGSKL